MKTCTKCSVEKPLDQFRIRVKRKNLATHSWCNSCINLQNKLRRDYAMERGYKLKCTFGLTHQDYETLSELQDHRCAICQKHETILTRQGRVRKLAVDHDHKTGKIRGLLCAGCNTALGRFEDDISILERAIRYLRGEGL